MRHSDQFSIILQTIVPVLPMKLRKFIPELNFRILFWQLIGREHGLFKIVLKYFSFRTTHWCNYELLDARRHLL